MTRGPRKRSRFWRKEEWWEYLNRIEEATEAALATDLDLLPALMLRSRRLTSPGATGATQR